MRFSSLSKNFGSLPLSLLAIVIPVSIVMVGTAFMQSSSGAKADLSISFATNKREYAAGDVAMVRLSAYNKGPKDAQNVAITFTTDTSGLTFNTPLPQGCSAQSTTLTCIVPKVGKGKRIARIISFVVPSGLGCGSGLKGTATTASTAIDPVPANNIRAVVVKVACDGEADLSISYRADKTSPRKGETVTYTALLRNDGPDDAGNVIVEVAVPSGLRIGELEPECSAVGGKILCRFENIGPDDELELEILGTVEEQAACNGFLLSAARIDSSSSDVNTKDNLSKSAVRVQCPGTPVLPSTEKADLVVTAQPDKKEYEIGEVGTLRVSVSNKGPQAATSFPIEVAFNLSEIDALQEPYPPGCALQETDGGKKISCFIEQLAKGARVTKEFSFVIPDNSSCHYTKRIGARAFSAGLDPTPLNNHASAIYNIKCIGKADLAVTVTADKTVVRKGDQILYKVRISNAGPQNARNVHVDVRKPQFGKLNVIPDGCTPTSLAIGNLQFICRQELLDAKDSVTFDFPVTVMEENPCGFNVQHFAQVTSLASDPDFSTNSSQVTVKFSCNAPILDAPLMVTQTPNVSKVLPGGTVHYTLLLRNAGSTALTDIELKDTFDSSAADVTQFLEILQPGATKKITYTVRVPEDAPCSQPASHALSASVGGSSVSSSNITSIDVRVVCDSVDLDVRLLRLQQAIKRPVPLIEYQIHIRSKEGLPMKKMKMILTNPDVIIQSTVPKECRKNDPAGLLVCDFPASTADRFTMWLVLQPTLGYPSKRCLHTTPTIQTRVTVESDDIIDPQQANNVATDSVQYCE